MKGIVFGGVCVGVQSLGPPSFKKVAYRRLLNEMHCSSSLSTPVFFEEKKEAEHVANGAQACSR